MDNNPGVRIGAGNGKVSETQEWVSISILGSN